MSVFCCRHSGDLWQMEAARELSMKTTPACAMCDRHNRRAAESGSSPFISEATPSTPSTSFFPNKW